VYSRDLDGFILTLSASGWTYESTFVLFDYETESLWYHRSGESGLTCISGVFADEHLPEFESIQIRWSEWLSQHPYTEYLVRSSGMNN
jgi:hypothetical protein